MKKIDAKVVYANDEFEYEEGTEQKLKHVPTLEEDRGEIVAAYAIAKFADGEVQIEVLTKADIEKIRKSSASQGGPWSNWYDEMARKSAVRRLCKYLPYDPVLEKALDHATEVDSGVRMALDPVLEEKKPRSKSLAESLREKSAAQEAAQDEAETDGKPAQTEKDVGDYPDPPPPDDDLGGRL